MTNEEKAKEIGRKWYFDNMQSNEAAYRGAFMMAEWKDSQYAEEKKELVGLVNMLPTNENNQTIIEDLKSMLS